MDPKSCNLLFSISLERLLYVAERGSYVGPGSALQLISHVTQRWTKLHYLLLLLSLGSEHSLIEHAASIFEPDTRLIHHVRYIT